MDLTLNYITDSKGKKMSVIILYQEWLTFEVAYKRLSNKLSVLKNIKAGIQEVKDARKKGIELQNLEDFLNEC